METTKTPHKRACGYVAICSDIINLRPKSRRDSSARKDRSMHFKVLIDTLASLKDPLGDLFATNSLTDLL